jgi:hypothetical protein
VGKRKKAVGKRKKAVGKIRMKGREKKKERRNLSRDLGRSEMKAKLRVLCSLSYERKENHTVPFPRSFRNETCTL